MGERRKRKSLWDTEAETKHFSGTSENNSWTGEEHHTSHDSGNYHEFCASGSYKASKFRDHPGQQSLESIEESPVAPRNGSFSESRGNASEGKEIGGGNRYYQNMSPGFKYSHSVENDRSHSHRYPGRGRSRSRSGSRNRGRSRSRSLSRGRERERVRGRSRSRSRSRSDGSPKGLTRSRSPIGDYRHQSYGWGDRRYLPEKSTEICSDFTAGRCRRGSQCKFFHPKNISHRDADLVGADTSESWRDMADHGHISRHSYSRGPRFESQDDVSDSYHGEDEQFHNKSRSRVPCKDFMKSKCRWGDTCRFSHHVTSSETFGKGTRYTSSDRDIEHQPFKNEKPPCKYFAAGKCDRDNCRFSHEDSKFKKKNRPTWNDATRITDNVKPSGRDESIVTVSYTSGDNTNAGIDNRWSHGLENENINRGIPKSRDNSIDRDRQHSSRGSGGYGVDIGSADSISKENIADRQELLMLHRSQLEKQDTNLYADQRFSMKAWQQNVSPVSHVQQQDHGVVENNQASSLRSDVLDTVVNSRNAIDPILLSGQNINQNGANVFRGHSSISDETDCQQNVPCPKLSDVFSGDLKGPDVHLVANLNLQSKMHDNQKAIQMTGMLETKVPQFLPNLLTSEHSAQFTNSTVSFTGEQVSPATHSIMFPTQGFENEHSQKNSDTEVSNSTGMTLSFPDTSGHVPVVKTTNIQFNPLRVSHDLLNPTANGGGNNEQGNHTEQGNQMQMGRSSPVFIVDMETDNSEVEHSGRLKLKQERELANSEADEGKTAIREESKGDNNNKHSETVDDHGKAEESIANKDDKGMRLFKNSLIEFVKDILKPTWKEGRMSRDVHKTIVKKVVDKVTSTIPVDHIPKTQDKVEQYLSCSKPKIAKLVQAYVGRCLKTDS